MPSLVIRRARYSWASLPGAVDLQQPRYVSGTATGSAVALTFDENIRAGAVVGQFTATVNAVARTVSAVASITGKVVTLTLASAVTAGQAVVVTYTPGGTASQRLADAGRGIEADAFVTPAITAT